MNSRNKLMLKWIGILYILGTIIVATTVVSITFLLGKDISMDMLTNNKLCDIHNCWNDYNKVILGHYI